MEYVSKIFSVPGDPADSHDPDNPTGQWPVGKVAGSFVQAWIGNHYSEKKNRGEEDLWEADLSSMEKMGMRYLIIQDPLNEEALKDCLQTAQKHRIKLIFALSSDKYCNTRDYDFFSNIDGVRGAEEVVRIDVEEARETLRNISRQVQELSDAGDIDYSESIYAWYFNQEFYNSSKFIFSILPSSADQYAELLSSHLNQYIEAVQATSYVDRNGTTVSLDRPLVFSPYYSITEAPYVCNVTQYEEFLNRMFSRTGFRSTDILAPQDCFGANSIDKKAIEPGIMMPWVEAYQLVAKKRGIRFWINNDLFESELPGQTTEGSDYKPVSVSSFIRNYNLTDRYAEEHIVFSWNHYYNPLCPWNGREYPGYDIPVLHKAFRSFVASQTYQPLEVLVTMAGGKISKDDRSAKTVTVSINGIEIIYIDRQGTPFIDDDDGRWYVWYPEFSADFDL